MEQRYIASVNPPPYRRPLPLRKLGATLTMGVGVGGGVIGGPRQDGSSLHIRGYGFAGANGRIFAEFAR